MQDDVASRDALFHALISTAVDGIIVIDSKGTIEIFNAACEMLFGYGQEAVGQNVKMLMPESYRSAHDTYIARYQSTGEKRIIGIGREIVGKRKDGSTFPMYLSVGEGKIAGRPVYVGILHDLTKEKERESRVKALQSELLHVTRLNAMGQMASALAHELNQPLTAVTNYVKAARHTLDGIGGTAIGKAQELMDKAAAQTLRAGQIIRRLRDFIEKRDSERVQESLNKVVEEAVALAQIGAMDLNVTVELNFDPALTSILMDKIQVQQVIINLVRNAIEAMQSVEHRVLRVATLFNGGYAEIAVMDTGPGLAPEVADRLFEPFVTTKVKGMGIGLSICRSIIEAHGGRIWAEANEGGGTAFHVRLPLLAGKDAQL